MPLRLEDNDALTRSWDWRSACTGLVWFGEGRGNGSRSRSGWGVGHGLGDLLRLSLLLLSLLLLSLRLLLAVTSAVATTAVAAAFSAVPQATAAVCCFWEIAFSGHRRRLR